jgi:hypothetical protein
MKRAAATLAGLALVGVPAAIAMGNTDVSSHASKQQPSLMLQRYQTSPGVRFHNGRHCHHPGGQQNGTGTADPGV